MENTNIQDDLLIIYLVGEASLEERHLIEARLQADTVFKQRYESIKRLWDASARLAPGEPDNEAAFRRFKAKVNEREQSKLRKARIRNIGTWIGIAATFLLIAGGVWYYGMSGRTEDVQLITQNETRRDSLQDGSVVTLNRQTHLAYPSGFEGNQRRVQLDTGEAFFNVARNKNKPFLITAGHVTIRVVGTSFNVKYKQGKVEVIVETGVVTVTDRHASITLQPGEKVSVEQGASKLQKKKNPDQLYRWYRDKRFVANDTPLWRMVEVLNDAYDCRIVIGREELYNLPLNTTFENDSLENVLDVIGRTFKLRVEKKNNVIVLK